MAVSEKNLIRNRSIMLSRAYKELFFAAMPRRALYGWLFRGESGDMRMVGEHVLADLREFCRLSDPTIFSPEPLEMARREGRREVGLRIVTMLGLDETAVRHLMRLDDGLGG